MTGVLVLLCLAPALPGATSLRFEDGDSVQLIDLRGELLEWPARSEAFAFGGPTIYFTSNGGTVESPEPLGSIPLWPRRRPDSVGYWLKAADHLAQGDDGRLYEIRTVGFLFGRLSVQSISPEPVMFPFEQPIWTQFASYYAMRLAISINGELWAWTTISTNLPPYFAQGQPNWYGLIPATVGPAQIADSKSSPGGPIVCRIHPPSEGALFAAVKFAGVPTPMAIGNIGGAADPTPPPAYGLPFVALASDGELYQYGYQLRKGLDPWGVERYQVLWTNTVSKVARPVEVSEWRDFWSGGEQIFALSEAGELYALGSNQFGQLGAGSLTTPDDFVRITKPPGVAEWRRLAARSRSTIALGDDHKLYAWGELSYLRNVVAEPADATYPHSALAFIKTRPTRLDVGSDADPVMDFATSNDFLAVLLASGRVVTFYSFSSRAIVQHASSREDPLPDGALVPAINRPPFCRLRSPAVLSRWIEPGVLNVIAEAVDLDGQVTDVSLSINGQDAGAMIPDGDLHVFTWNRVLRGRYELVVRATDDSGNHSESIPVVLYADRDLPVITGMQRTIVGVTRFYVYGQESAPTRVEWSDDLVTWNHFRDLTLNASPPQAVLDFEGHPRRFYRIAVDEPVWQPGLPFNE